MGLERSLRPVRRCAGCGSRLPAGGRQCAICGDLVPRRLTPPGVALESLLAVLAAAVVVSGLLWLRSRGGPLVDPAAQVAVITRLPTAMPTYTPAPTPLPTWPPNTPQPPTPTPLPAVIIHEVVSGDTLFGIAAQYGVTGDAILEANADVIDSPHQLSIGQELRVPIAPSELPVVAEAPVLGSAQPAEVVAAAGAGQAGAAAGEVGSLQGDSVAVAAGPGLYVVMPGDTVADVAGEHGLETAELVRLNPVRLADADSVLEPGTELVVRPGVEAAPGRSGAVLAPADAGIKDGHGGGLAALPPDDLGLELFPAPLPLAPGDGVKVKAEAPLLRWSSAGVLPPGVYYVVALRDAGNLDARPHVEWVTSNATAVRVPAAFRPALGGERSIAWTVTVRRRVGRLIGPDEGVILSQDPEWRAFTWAP